MKVNSKKPRRQFEKALEIDSGFALAYLNRGFTYSDKGQYDKAFADFNKAVDIDPVILWSTAIEGLPATL